MRSLNKHANPWWRLGTALAVTGFAFSMTGCGDASVEGSSPQSEATIASATGVVATPEVALKCKALDESRAATRTERDSLGRLTKLTYKQFSATLVYQDGNSAPLVYGPRGLIVPSATISVEKEATLKQMAKTRSAALRDLKRQCRALKGTAVNGNSTGAVTAAWIEQDEEFPEEETVEFWTSALAPNVYDLLMWNRPDPWYFDFNSDIRRRCGQTIAQCENLCEILAELSAATVCTAVFAVFTPVAGAACGIAAVGLDQLCKADCQKPPIGPC